MGVGVKLVHMPVVVDAIFLGADYQSGVQEWISIQGYCEDTSLALLQRPRCRPIML